MTVINKKQGRSGEKHPPEIAPLTKGGAQFGRPRLFLVLHLNGTPEAKRKEKGGEGVPVGSRADIYKDTGASKTKSGWSKVSMAYHGSK